MMREPRAETMAGWRIGAFSFEITAHPRDAFPLHDVVGVYHLVYFRNRGHMPAHHDGRVR